MRLFAFILALVLAGPAFSKNFAVPSNDPAATITIPDDWETDTIDFGYSAWSPGKDVFFSIEYAENKKRLDQMIRNNDEWMTERGFKNVRGPTKMDWDFQGLKGEVLMFKAMHDGEETQIDFIFIPGGKGRVIMLTIWGSDEEREKEKNAINGIIASVKPIN